jgi:hypothetical protein
MVIIRCFENCCWSEKNCSTSWVLNLSQRKPGIIHPHLWMDEYISYFTIQSVARLFSGMVGWQMNWKNLEGSGTCTVGMEPQHLPWRNSGTRKTWVMIATVLTEIRTDQLPNMGIECYHYASPLNIYLSRKLCISKWSSHHIVRFQILQHTISYLGFEVHLVVTMKSTILWEVTPRSLVYVTDVSEGHNASIFRVE